MGHRRHGFDVKNVVLEIGDRFAEDGCGVGPRLSVPP
jgi:hypothetical protein